MKHVLILLLFCLLILSWSCEKAVLGTEDTPAPTTLHASHFANVLDSLRYALDLPALAGAIVTETSTVAAATVGYRRYGGSVAVAINDQFHLGSNTKAFTAVLIGVLVDEGLVKWTTTLPEIFPELASSMRPEYRNVAVRDIMSHSAGLIRDPAMILQAASPMEQRTEVVAWAMSQPPACARGTYLYSNLGYIIAGAIAEKLTGRSYEDLLFEHVILPLGITSAGFGPMGTPGLEDQPLQHTNGHSPVEPTPSGDLQPIYNPAGRLHLSIGDWALYIRWVLAAENGHQTLLTDATARMLTSSIVATDGEGYYGMGWMIIDRSWAGGRVLEHSGSNIFNYSEAAIAPYKHFAVIVATNQGPGTKANPIDPAAGRLIDFYLNGR